MRRDPDIPSSGHVSAARSWLIRRRFDNFESLALDDRGRAGLHDRFVMRPSKGGLIRAYAHLAWVDRASDRATATPATAVTSKRAFPGSCWASIVPSRSLSASRSTFAPSFKATRRMASSVPPVHCKMALIGELDGIRGARPWHGGVQRGVSKTRGQARRLAACPRSVMAGAGGPNLAESISVRRSRAAASEMVWLGASPAALPI